MGKLDIRYVAGLIDADGSLCITLNTRGTSLFIATWVVNFRQIHKSIVEEVGEKFGVGKVYYSHRYKDYNPNRRGIWSWQTIRQADTLYVAKLLYPHLHIKKDICEVFIDTLEKWMSYGTSIGGKREYGKTTRPLELLDNVLNVALSINKCAQTSTARKNKSKRIEEIKGRILNFNKVSA